MAEHAHITPTSRRHLLAALSGAAVAGGALVLALPSDAPAVAVINPHSDGKLLALLAEFDILEQQALNAYPSNCTMAEEEAADRVAEPLREKQQALLDPICQMQARTIGGVIARARSLTLWSGGSWITAPDSPDGYHDQRLIAALVRDLGVLEARV